MRDESTALQAALAELIEGDESSRPVAVDVLLQAGIRSDHSVAQPSERDSPPAVADAAWKDTDTFPLFDPDKLASPPGPAPPEPYSGEAELASRYQVLELLGEGGMGEVRRARDRNLGREVALKTIPPRRMDPRRLGRFVAEARITAQLEHPGIVPIHDLFISDDGSIYYTMKRVQGRTLRDVLDGLSGQVEATVERWNLNRLLGIYRTACQAVAYAHTRRVVHRDLKPDNIMLGDFGEVLIMDWGVARLMDDGPEELVEVHEAGANLLQTLDGAMVGSPAYMAPESLEAVSGDVSPNSDVFSLGVILYEILTLQRPFRASNLPRLLYLVAKGEFDPPSLAAPEREIPPDVEAICMRALAHDADDRYPDAGALTHDLEFWLERVQAHSEADRLVGEGKERLRHFASAASDAEEADVRARALKSGLQSWDPLELKRIFWKAEQEHAEAEATSYRLFGECEASYESALSHVSEYRPAREGLAALYWIRFLQAEEARKKREMRRWRDLVVRYAPERYARKLQGDGTLTIDAAPLGAQAELRPLGLEDGRLVPAEPLQLGTCPLSRVATPMGSYVVELRAEGCSPVLQPIVLRRLQNLALSIQLPPAEKVPQGFVPIPAGPIVLGGDEAALSGLSERSLALGNYAIARYPVSVEDYLLFLADRTRSNPEEALRRSPRARGSRGGRQEPLFILPPDGAFDFPFEDRDGTLWYAEQPIVSIGYDDAGAYAAWLAERSGHPFRLPTEPEWEKAARGPDRRSFPWGNRFDASFCVMGESSPDAPDLPAMGAVPSDQSPYGVRDLGGGVRDWCARSDYGDLPDQRFPIRGGSYGTVEVYCRCASRTLVERDYVGSHVGFRLALSL